MDNNFTFSWRDLGSCLDHTGDLFFPAGETGLAAEQAEAAKSICSDCPVQIDCLGYAVETGQRFGVWGGTTEEERARLRRRWLASVRSGNSVSLEDLLPVG